VAFERPGQQRVTLLWNGDGQPLRVRLPRRGSTAVAVSLSGAEQPLTPDARGWAVSLPGATAHFRASDTLRDPDGYHYIGGAPVLVVEEGVDPASPVDPPSLA
jgi:hypothetical protein